MHAAMEFAAEHPSEWSSWHKNSNSIIVLNCKSERDLFDANQKFLSLGIKTSQFREPDIGNELTSVAIAPSPRNKKLLSNFPLAGKKIPRGSDERLRKKFEIVEAMENCFQCPGQNMIRHGESVRDYLLDLIGFITDPHHSLRFNWRFPRWLLVNASELSEAIEKYDSYTIEKYALWHDCGKPFCREVDENGKIHYPNHAQRSSEVFLEMYPEETRIASLIAQDMDLTLCKNDEDLMEFSKRKDSILLLLSTLASMHSNAAMFGGITSDSFKIKWKSLTRGEKRFFLKFVKLNGRTM